MTSQADWPTYNGQLGGNRFSALDQIDKSNVTRLAPRWTYSLAAASRLQVTPVVVDGVMYVTTANECHALDAGTGRRIWDYRRPRTKGLAGDAAGGINRGVAVAGDRVFMVTDHAHIIALDRFTGTLLWDTEMADWRQNYGATSAPLAVGGLVVSGISGGDEGVRGFLAAFDQATGKEVWRFWTVPKRGEPGSETWKGKDIDHPCASTWLTGTYDPDLDTLYWPTGNPCPDYDGSERIGDNLYSDSILALDAKSGRLKWYYQYTPHDVWDWDAQQPPVLVDADWQGKPRRLLLHANRNGFFYVLDRTNGALLLAKPFVKKLTWAREIGPDGRPVLNPGQEPTPEGTKVCPAVEGATNWFSTSFNPATGLYYVQTLEKCTVYTKEPGEWQAGQSYYGGNDEGGAGRAGPEGPPRDRREDRRHRLGAAADRPRPLLGRHPRHRHAASSSSAKTAAPSWRSTPRAARPLWHFQANTLWKASPMTYMFDGKQHIAVAVGPEHPLVRVGGVGGYFRARPTAAEGLVDGNKGDGGVLLAADELVLCGVDRAFGVQDGKEVLEAARVAVRGQGQGAAGGVYGGPQRSFAGALSRVGGECILDLFQGREDLLLVLEQGLFLAGVLHFDVGANFSAREDGPADCRDHVPELG